ncbi:MAG: NfeD family protein [Bacteroidales bacterium]
MALDIFIILILALFGIGLVILEIFLIPGFGFAGIAGIAFMGGSVWYAYEQLGLLGGNITLLICILTLIIGIYRFIKGKMLSRIALNKEIDSTAPNKIGTEVQAGETGVTLSIMNPMGTVIIGNKTYEAKSEEGFIEVNKPVEIIKVDTTNIIVKQIHHK